jgi:hypothetical protein
MFVDDVVGGWVPAIYGKDTASSGGVSAATGGYVPKESPS